MFTAILCLCWVWQVYTIFSFGWYISDLHISQLLFEAEQSKTYIVNRVSFNTGFFLYVFTISVEYIESPAFLFII